MLTILVLEITICLESNLKAVINVNTRLTKSEEQLMDFIWTMKEPLSGSEMIEKLPNRMWKENYVYLMLRSLMNKGLIEVKAYKTIGCSNARLWGATKSREEFFAEQITENADEKSTFNLFATLVDKENDPERLLKLRKLVDKKLQEKK